MEREQKAEMTDDKSVILFGRSGSGKSTVANMLVTGSLNVPLFPLSSGWERETQKLQKEEGRGWQVLETVGLGELKGGAVSSVKAKKKLPNFLTDIEGSYNHFVYVVKKDRIDEKAEQQLWNLFTFIFTGDKDQLLLDHAIILITSANERWLDRNRSKLEKTFDGCRKFVCVDFPRTYTADVRVNAWLERKRKVSLAILEQKLDSMDLGTATPYICSLYSADLPNPGLPAAACFCFNRENQESPSRQPALCFPLI
eukprot:c25777_g1_i2 orf=456-1220(-)